MIPDAAVERLAELQFEAAHPGMVAGWPDALDADFQADYRRWARETLTELVPLLEADRG